MEIDYKMTTPQNGVLSPMDRLKEIVRLVLNSWPPYQFAIKNQLGGSQTLAKVYFKFI